MHWPEHGRPTRTDRGVAPVVAVILLIGVTTTIAASAAATQLGHGVPSPAPAVAWELEVDEEGVLTITHAGGPPVDGSQLVIDAPTDGPGMTLADVGPARWSTGSTATVVLTDHDATSVKIVWRPFGTDGMVVAEWHSRRRAVATDLGLPCQ